MYGVQVLVAEHDRILQFIELVRHDCLQVMEGEEPDPARFREYLDFGRNYADKHHHGKEEQILFRYMTAELGPIADKLINQGMIVEHEIGRTHLRDLEDAIERYERLADTAAKLDIVTNAAGYCRDLERHIERENSAVFTFGESKLDDASKAKVNAESRLFEEQMQANKEKYEHWLDQRLAEHAAHTNE